MIVVPKYVILAGIAIALLVILPVSAEPTVTISDFEVTPQVLMPGDQGIITVTLKNTASSASLTERTGALSPESSGTTTVTDINVLLCRKPQSRQIV